VDSDQEQLRQLPDDDAVGSWPLVKVLDVVAIALTSIVVIRAIGSVVAALGVPSIAVPAGLLGHIDVSIPTYLRFQYGTDWADIITGLLLLASVGLLALPRMVWNVGVEDQGLRVSPSLVWVTGVVAATATVASVIGIINVLWNLPALGPSSTEAVSVANGTAAAALAALTMILCRFAMGYVVAPDSVTLDEPTDPTPE
jgi:hypothetical protein